MNKPKSDKNKDEKLRLFFDMQEHPERYTDEQVKDLLADDKIHSFFRDMAVLRMAMKKENPQKINIAEAWKEFANKNKPETYEAKQSYRTHSNRWKIAATIIGVIFISGITFATTYYGIFRNISSDKPNHNKTEYASNSHLNKANIIKANAKEKSDSIVPNPMVFDNAKLGDVVSQLATFYHVKFKFKRTESQDIRIFFNWDKTKTLKQNLEILNAFERIQITETDGTLVVE